MQIGLLMHKLKNISTPNDLSAVEIEFLTGKNSIHDIQKLQQDPVGFTKMKSISKIDHSKHLNDIPTALSGLNKCNDLKPNSHMCPTCETADHIVRDQFGGMVLCSNCGQVMEDSIFDHGPEWKNYDDNCGSNRCGLPTNSLLPQSSLGTTIRGNCNYRLKTLHNWGLMPYKERSLNVVLNTIKSKCAAAKLLGCIEDDAKILYKIASECKGINKKNNIIIRGKNRIGLMAACVFYACKRRGHAKSIKDIATLFEIETSCVNKGCKNFSKYVKYKNIDYNTNITHPVQYIQQFCEKLKISKDILDVISEVAINIQQMNIVPSHTPISVAAACILLCASKFEKLNISKHLISTTFGISDVTLVKAYNKLEKFKTILLNNEKVNKIINKNTKAQSDIIISDELTERLTSIRKINIDSYENITDIKLHKYVDIDMTKELSKEYRNCIDYRNEKNKSYNELTKRYKKYTTF